MAGMRAAILGFGSMGHEIETVLSNRGHEISARIDPRSADADAPALSPEIAARSDVAIEFTTPDAAVTNINACAAAGLSVVVGTTGWHDALPQVSQTVAAASTGLLHGSNFSVGAHVFFALVKRASQLVRDLTDYDIACAEIHHRRKKDSPSGTALSLGAIILEHCPRKTAIVTERLDRPIEPHEVHISSMRGGEFPGKHTVFLDSLADTIEVSHTARSRGGFALGAVLGAEWLLGKTGVYDVETFVADLLGQR